MKVLAPAITCLVTSHMKPYLRDALESLLAQTRRDFEAVVVDSGQWIGRADEAGSRMAAIHADFAGHPLVRWVVTGEREDLKNRVCPVGWVFNEAVRGGLVRGRFVCTFYDDDLYRPQFMEKMAGHLEATGAQAVWCSQARSRLTGAGWSPAPGIRADGARGPGQMDCQVDGAQVMFRRTLLDVIGDPWLPENPEDSVCRHSDGIFLEKLALAAGRILPVSEELCEHRFTPVSAYTPS